MSQRKFSFKVDPKHNSKAQTPQISVRKFLGFERVLALGAGHAAPLLVVSVSHLRKGHEAVTLLCLRQRWVWGSRRAQACFL